MVLSLRSKLFSLVVAAIALAAVPIILLTFRELNDMSLRRERESFGNAVLLIEDNIGSRYLSLLSNNILGVMQRKNQLRQMAILARTTWLDMQGMPMGAGERVIGSWAQPLLNFGLHLDLFEAAGARILGSPLIRELAMDPERTDLKGRPMTAMLRHDRLPADGMFAVFGLDRDLAGVLHGVPGPLLVYLLPVPEREAVIALAMQLSDMQREAADTEGQIAQSTQEKFDSLELHENGFLALLAGDGRILAFKGNPQGREEGFIPAHGLDQAREKGFVDFADQESGNVGSRVFRIAHFKALDWYIVAAVPRDEMEAPARVLLRRMVAFALGSAVLSVLGMLLLTARLIKPLRTLTGQAQALAGIDLTRAATAGDSGESPLLALARELPVAQRDEVGTLAAAFGDMGRALDQNIRSLMETTTVKQRMEGELNAARDIQMGILPAAGAPTHPDCLVSSFLEPAKEVGGDLFDFFQVADGRQALIIGDVSDKGVPAALFMSMTVTLVRYALAQTSDPAEVMTRINDRLSENNPGCMFVTLFIGLFDPATGAFEYANGGHCQPLVVGPGGAVRAIEGMSGPVVGAMGGLPYASHRAVLGAGETCLLYSDGVSEAMDEERRLFGEDRVKGVLAENCGETPEEMLRRLHESIAAHRGTAAQSDDITMLCFTRRR
jgi:sigma-B regulation protein RsbU (phosphoserine phosphatase)